VSESVLLTAEVAGKVAAYHWAHAIDQETWTAVPQTLKARTTVASLVPGRKSLFRVRAVRRTGTDDWTMPVAFLVR